jgi:hypothetical protein
MLCDSLSELTARTSITLARVILDPRDELGVVDLAVAVDVHLGHDCVELIVVEGFVSDCRARVGKGEGRGRRG